MELIFEIVIVILGFSALVSYSFWYLFVGREALFTVPDFSGVWQSITQARNFMPAQGTVYTSDDACQRLKTRMKELEERRETLLADLKKQYCRDKLRELNIVCNHIDVATARLTGQYNCPEANLEDINLIYRP